VQKGDQSAAAEHHAFLLGQRDSMLCVTISSHIQKLKKDVFL